jgi:hypothetical protein
MKMVNSTSTTIISLTNGVVLAFYFSFERFSTDQATCRENNYRLFLQLLGTTFMEPPTAIFYTPIVALILVLTTSKILLLTIESFYKSFIILVYNAFLES